MGFLPFTTLLILAFLESITIITGQNDFLIHIGSASNKQYFATRVARNLDLIDGMDYCHMYGVMPGSFSTLAEFELIVNFLNSSNQIPSNNERALWIPATDHRLEGTYRWMRNSARVDVGNWSPGMPSGNRSINCLVINGDGFLMEEVCTKPSKAYMTLCETPNLYHTATPPETNAISKDSQDNLELTPAHEITPLLTLIGSVGAKTYYLNDELEYWPDALDTCHSNGMRLAAPESGDEFTFLHNYAIEQADNDAFPSPLFYVAGTDMLSVSCLKSNTEFRWFYSGNPIVNHTTLIGNNIRYMCTMVTPSGLSTTGCSTGGGIMTASICEM